MLNNITNQTSTALGKAESLTETRVLLRTKVLQELVSFAIEKGEDELKMVKFSSIRVPSLKAFEDFMVTYKEDLKPFQNTDSSESWEVSAELGKAFDQDLMIDNLLRLHRLHFQNNQY